MQLGIRFITTILGIVFIDFIFSLYRLKMQKTSQWREYILLFIGIATFEHVAVLSSISV